MGPTLSVATSYSQTGRAYSRGMQQKLAIICALVKETDILFLDEPTLGLDFQSNKEIMAIIEELAHQEQNNCLNLPSSGCFRNLVRSSLVVK